MSPVTDVSTRLDLSAEIGCEIDSILWRSGYADRARVCVLGFVWQMCALYFEFHETRAFSMDRRPLIPIDADMERIERCEQRLALSASLAAGLLLDAFQVEDDVKEDVEVPVQSPALPGVVAPPHESLLQPQSISPTDRSMSAADPDPSSLDPSSLGEQSPGHGSTGAGGSPDLLTQAALLRDRWSLDGSGQTVAVIDSGIAWDHVSLGSGFGPGFRVVGGWDFAEDDSNPYDDGPAGYHGTHVSGLLAGQSDQVAGVAPASDLVALRVFDDGGQGQLQWIESALQWVHDNQNTFESPITTVNLSVGAALDDANRNEAIGMLEDELQLLREDDILVFAASGNLFERSPGLGVLYPASSESVVAVGSLGPSGDLSDFAQRNDGLLATRGEAITSAVPDHVFGWDGKVDDVAPLDGTSMATPQVAAASMLVRQAMIQQGMEPTADSILARLREAAIESVDPLTGATYHTIDLEAALADLSEADAPMTVTDRFDGSNASEHLVLDLTDGIRLRMDDQVYLLEGGNDPDEPLVITVGGGHDSLQIVGSDRAERLILRPPSEMVGQASSSLLTAGQARIELRGFEHVQFEGGGGSDRASLFDSGGSDTLTSRPGIATLKGVGFQFDTVDVPRVYVHGTSGGTDTAFLHDGPGDDDLAVRPQFTSLRSDDTFQLAYGFEKVYAYATAGGNDSARLYDSSGDDTMSISAERSIIAGPGYHVSARGFESTEGHAIAGGHDVARIYADETSSRWHATENMLQWTGIDRDVRVARGFERSLAFEKFEAIDISTQALESQAMTPLTAEPVDAKRQAMASRIIFEALGDGPAVDDLN